jgi:hypothetical protein
VSHESATFNLKLIAFGVASKVVVIIDDQDSRIWVFLALEIRGRESADASTNHNKVVEIGIGLLYRTPIAPTLPRKLMGDLK